MALKNLPYPDEVQETISKFVPSAQVTDFFKQRGILIAANSREKFGEFGKLLFLDYNDYEELHDLATTGKPGQSISGFDVYISDSSIDENINVKDEVVNWFETQRNAQMQVEDLRETDEETLQGRLVYTRRVPGKYELVGKVESNVEFELKPTVDNKWHVTYFPEKITDQQQLKDIITNAVGNKCTIDVPHIRGLPHSKRIEFFDTFLQHKFYQWALNDVVGLKIKEPEQSEQETEEDEDSDEMEQSTELERKALGSIREAILKGQNLRTNPFVKQFEKDGYYFQSMTFRFDHKHKSLTIDLVVNFKLRPIGLEIGIEKSVESIDEKIEETSLSTSEESKVLETFWETAKMILSNLRREAGSG